MTIQDTHPLAPLQQGMLIETLNSPGAGVYIVQFCWDLEGPLDARAMRAAWGAALQRHPALRTCFTWDGVPEPQQLIAADIQVPWTEVDWRAYGPAQQALRLSEHFLADRTLGFVLDRAPLMRILLIRVADTRWKLFWTHHHLLLDGWSLPIVMTDVVRFYNQARATGVAPVAQPAPSYSRYLSWLGAQDMAAAEGYWRGLLRGFHTPTRLAGGAPRLSNLAATDIDYCDVRLTAEHSRMLQGTARRHRLTMNTLLAAAWGLVVTRYTGQDDVVFGATTAGRPADLPDVDRIVGLFINTLPLRFRIFPHDTVLDGLTRLQTQQAESRSFEYAPLLRVQEWSEITAAEPLFDTVFSFEGYPAAGREQQFADLRLGPLTARTTDAYPITAVVMPGIQLRLHLAYNRRVFEAATIARMMEHWQRALLALAQAPSQQMVAVEMLSDAERKWALEECNQTDGPDVPPVTRQIESQAAEIPDATAVTGLDRTLSYADLNGRANQLARRLRDLGAGSESRVGVCVERDPLAIVALLAVLKAGAAFVPLDPAYPAERLTYILDDARVNVLVTQSHLVDLFSGAALDVFCLDTDWETLAQTDRGNLQPFSQPRNLAYIIYTSGSSGQPKGVMVEHRALSNLVASQISDLHLDRGTPVVHTLSFAFDASMTTWVNTLAAGGSLAVLPADSATGEDLHLWMRRTAIEVLSTVPSVVRSLPRKSLPALKTIVVGGERCAPELVAEWAPDRAMANVYGATECTVLSTLGAVVAGEPITIGTPRANTRIYVLDSALRPVPAGVEGELYIGGTGVARGYVSQPGLTAQSFIADPFGAPGARLYRTKDLGRRREDGRLEFLRRTDDQLKIRGHRVEPAEIEAVLRQQDDIADALVAAQAAAGGDDVLVAYVVPRTDESGRDDSVDLNEARHAIERRLPSFMRPAAFVVVDRFPLTVSGKVDRATLFAGSKLTSSTHDGAQPRTPIEEILCTTFAETLAVAKVGLDESFFDLGGHSLMATQLVSRIRKVMGIELDLRRVFESPTVSALALHVETALRGTQATSVPAPSPVPRGQIVPASHAQQRLWFVDQLESGSAGYNSPGAVHLLGPLKFNVFNRAFAEVVRRHEALRTRFGVHDGQPVQIVSPAVSTFVARIDLRRLANRTAQRELVRLAEADAQQSFDLQSGPLLRASLVRLADCEHFFLVTAHHTIADGWSKAILLQELATLCGAFDAGCPSPLPELGIQYADYALWQRRWLDDNALVSDREYWLTRLRDLPATTFPRTVAGRLGTTRAADYVSVDLTPDLTEGLRRLARREGATLFMVLLAAFQVVLSRWTGQDDIVVGTDVAGRRWSELEPLIGCFVNQLVLRTSVAGDPTLSDLIASTRETCLGAYAHQDFPFERLVEELNPRRSLSRTPLFQVKLLLQNIPPAPQRFAGLEVTPVNLVKPGAQFDLLLSLREAEGRLLGHCVYVTGLYSSETVKQVLRHWTRVLEAMAFAPECKLSAIEMAEPERVAIEAFGSPRLPQQPSLPAHRAFEAQAIRIPDAVAIVSGHVTTTYDELNCRANQFAKLLREVGVRQEVRVAVCLPRRPEAIVVALAVAKAGGVFVPLDATYPPERLSMLLDDAAPSVLVSDSDTLPRLPIRHELNTLSVDADWPEAARQPHDNLPDTNAGTAAAYIIYTSGSTGRPKGVIVSCASHATVTNSLAKLYALEPGGRLLQSVSFAFDVAIADWSTTLASGATLVLAPDGVTSGVELRAMLQRSDATIAPVPMSVLAITSADDLKTLGTVLTGGEALSPQVVARWAQGRRMVNFYGLTECTVSTTAATIAPDRPPTIGQPLPHAAVRVLDDTLAPVPVGALGQLYIGGPSLARGYLNLPAPTAVRFIADPFGGEPGARLYRTGDRVRWDVDGTLHFLGRVDDQIQIRGHRVEPAEVEDALREHPAVRATAVVARVDDAGTELVAYVVPATGPLASSEVRRHLEERLPPSMIPSAFVMIESLPLTANGKLDRAALPAPIASAVEAYVAPATEQEQGLAEIWSALLPAWPMSALDNFFDRGGHSLLAAQLIGRIRDTFGVDLPLRAIFERPVLRDMAGEIRLAAANPAPLALVPVVRTSPLPASYAQRRLWLLDQLRTDDGAYNIPLALRLDGRLDRRALTATLMGMVERHEVLRTTLRNDDVAVWQEVGPAAIDLPVVDLSRISNASPGQRVARTTAFRPFDLERGPLLRALLIRLTGKAHVLVVTMHHVIADGASRAILLRELTAGYDARRHGRLPALPPLRVQYVDYAVWEQRRLSDDTRETQLAYWRATLRDAPLLQLPTDKDTRRTGGTVGGRIEVVLPHRETETMRRLCQERSLTPFMALFAMTQLALAEWTGETDIVVGVDTSGRGEPALEPLIGYFVNVLPIRTRIDPNVTARELLDDVRQSMVAAYANDGVPLDLLIQQLDPVRSERLNPFFDVVVSYEERGPEIQAIGDLRITSFPLGHRIPKYPFEVKMVDLGERVSVGLHYDVDLFSDSTIRHYADHFGQLAAALVDDPGRTVAQLLQGRVHAGISTIPQETLHA